MFHKVFSTVKYSLAAVNLLFLITGVIVLIVGISIQVAYNEYHPFLSQRFLSLPAFLIATGIIIILISFFGFWGATLENFYVNLLYAGLMVMVFIFQLSACIAGYVLYSHTLALLQGSLLETMPLYGASGNEAVTKLWDEVQREFECCGVTQGAREWPVYLPNQTQPDDSSRIPISCCPHGYGTISTFTCEANDVYPNGCAEVFGAWVSSHALTIGIIALILTLLQACAVGGALWIARRSKAEQI